MYAQVAVKSNTLLRNGAYGIVMRGVQKCTCAGASLRDRNSAPLCCIKLDTATDPASGSGNFLTETYLQLRHLEDQVLLRLKGGQTAASLTAAGAAVSRVSLDQFYGIEINDFAVKVSEAALWISRLKANGETAMLLALGDDDFPLAEKRPHRASQCAHLGLECGTTG